MGKRTQIGYLDGEKFIEALERASDEDNLPGGRIARTSMTDCDVYHQRAGLLYDVDEI